MNEVKEVKEAVVEEKKSQKKQKKPSKRKIRSERRKNDKVNDWDFSLIDCCEYDAGIAFDFCFRFPCAMSRLVADLNEKKHEDGACYSCCCCLCVSARARQLAMNRFRIKNDCFLRECIKTCCCPCCSGAQVKNQLEYLKYKDKNSAAPRQEEMKEKKHKKKSKKNKRKEQANEDDDSDGSDDSDSE